MPYYRAPVLEEDTSFVPRVKFASGHFLRPPPLDRALAHDVWQVSPQEISDDLALLVGYNPNSAYGAPLPAAAPIPPPQAVPLASGGAHHSHPHSSTQDMRHHAPGMQMYGYPPPPDYYYGPHSGYGPPPPGQYPPPPAPAHAGSAAWHGGPAPPVASAATKVKDERVYQALGEYPRPKEYKKPAPIGTASASAARAAGAGYGAAADKPTVGSRSLSDPSTQKPVSRPPVGHAYGGYPPHERRPAGLHGPGPLAGDAAGPQYRPPVPVGPGPSGWGRDILNGGALGGVPGAPRPVERREDGRFPRW